MFYEGRDTIFKKRIDSAVKIVKNLFSDVQTRYVLNYCKINNQPMNDRTLVENFCPVAANNSKILTKLEKKADPMFLTRAFVDVLEIDQAKLTEAFETNPSDLNQILDAFPENANALGKVIARAVFKLDTEERKTVINLLQDRSQLKAKVRMCGSHTLIITCEFRDKDFCEGNSLSRHFGLTILFALCLPGFIQGLTNLIFYQVKRSNFIYQKCGFRTLKLLNFAGRCFPARFWSRDKPKMARASICQIYAEDIVRPCLHFLHDYSWPNSSHVQV